MMRLCRVSSRRCRRVSASPTCCSDLLGHLAAPDRQIIHFAGQTTERLITPVQSRAFDLLGSPVPVRIT
jgi:hypothetical protein